MLRTKLALIVAVAATLILLAACNSDHVVDPLDRLSLPGNYLGVYSYYWDGDSEPLSQPIEFRFSLSSYIMWWDPDRDTSEDRSFCDAPGYYDTTGGITLGSPQIIGTPRCDTSLSPKGDFWPWLKGDTLILYQPSFVELNDVPTALEEACRQAIVSAGPSSKYALRRKLVLWPEE